MGGELDADDGAAAEIDVEREVVPEEDGEKAGNAEDQREAEEIPLLSQPVDFWIMKQFHLRFRLQIEIGSPCSLRLRWASKMTRETKTAVNRLASRPKVRVTAKPLTGPVPKMKRMSGRHDGGDVGVDDGRPGMAKALIDRGRGRLAGAEFFTDALEDEHVGVDAHADGEDDAGDAGQGKGGTGEAQEAEKNDEVQEERQVGIDAGALVVDRA